MKTQFLRSNEDGNIFIKIRETEIFINFGSQEVMITTDENIDMLKGDLGEYKIS